MTETTWFSPKEPHKAYSRLGGTSTINNHGQNVAWCGRGMVPPLNLLTGKLFGRLKGAEEERCEVRMASKIIYSKVLQVSIEGP